VRNRDRYGPKAISQRAEAGHLTRQESEEGIRGTGIADDDGARNSRSSAIFTPMAFSPSISIFATSALVITRPPLRSIAGTIAAAILEAPRPDSCRHQSNVLRLWRECQNCFAREEDRSPPLTGKHAYQP